MCQRMSWRHQYEYSYGVLYLPHRSYHGCNLIFRRSITATVTKLTAQTSWFLDTVLISNSWKIPKATSGCRGGSWQLVYGPAGAVCSQCFLRLLWMLYGAEVSREHFGARRKQKKLPPLEKEISVAFREKIQNNHSITACESPQSLEIDYTKQAAKSSLGGRFVSFQG